MFDLILQVISFIIAAVFLVLPIAYCVAFVVHIRQSGREYREKNDREAVERQVKELENWLV